MPSINTVQDSILQALQTVPNVDTVALMPEEFYQPGARFSINTPALLLGFVEALPEGEANNGVQPLTVEWEILALVNNRPSVLENHRAAVDLATAAVLALDPQLTDGQGTALPQVGMLKFQRMHPASLNSPSGQGVAAYSLEYTQRLWAGVDRRYDPTPLPQPVEIYLGYAPNTGPEHVDDYSKIGEVPEP